MTKWRSNGTRTLAGSRASLPVRDRSDPCHHGKADVVRDGQSEREPEEGEKDERHRVERHDQPERGSRTEARRKREQSQRPVALDVAERVDRLERGTPRQQAAYREEHVPGKVAADGDEHGPGDDRLHEPEERRRRAT